MKVTYTRYLGACALVSLVAGCASGAPAVTSAPTIPATTGVPNDTMRPAFKHSWMSQDAKKQNLLYAAAGNYVFVYSYPKGKLEGWLTGFNFSGNEIGGLCTDSKGNIFMPQQGSQEILEYAHGGTSPIATLSDAGFSPTDCSYDPTTGNLAVTNFNASGGYPGNVVIYANARGTGTPYANSSLYWYEWCSYDNKGNLFLDATNANISNPSFEFAELPSGGSSLNLVSLNQAFTLWDFNILGAVKWDGTYVDVLNPAPNSGPETVYQFTVSGSSGTEAGSTPLDTLNGRAQYWLQGKTLIAPSGGTYDVQYYSYPAGGSTTKLIDLDAWAATVSKAP